MASSRRAFIIMPFGRKTASDGIEIDFDAIYEKLLAPAVRAAGLQPHRADAERRGVQFTPICFSNCYWRSLLSLT